MVDELLEAHKRINSLEADIIVLTYRLDKITELLSSLLENGEGIVEELPVEYIDDRK